MSEFADWVPAFEGQRPPFPPGHEVNLRHGAFTKRVDELAVLLIDQVLSDPTTAYLSAPRWTAELAAWARAESQVQLLERWLGKLRDDAGGVEDLADERVRSAQLFLHRAEARAASRRKELGLTPLSAARLNRDKAIGVSASFDVAKRWAELEQRERERQEAGDDE